MAKVFTKLQILTPRLLLRPLEMQDFEAWAMFMADPEATRFLGGAQPRALAWRGFMTVAGAWHMQGFSMFSVVERATQRWVGRLGPWMPEGWPGTEVGWGIIRDCCCGRLRCRTSKRGPLLWPIPRRPDFWAELSRVPSRGAAS